MSGDIIQLNPEVFQSELKNLVKNSIEETPNAMPDEDSFHFNVCGHSFPMTEASA